MLIWGGWDRAIDLEAREVIVSKVTGEVLAEFGKVALELSFSDLIKGKISPEAICFIEPRITIFRPRGGEFRISQVENEGDPGSRDQTEYLQRLKDRIFTPPDLSHDLDRIRTVGVEDGTIWFDDRERGVSWKLEDIDTEIVRAENGLHAELELRLEDTDLVSSITFMLPYRAPEGTLQVQVDLDDLHPSLIYQVFPELAPFILFREGISGKIDLTIPPEERPISSDIHFMTDEIIAEGTLILESDLSGFRSVDIRRYEHEGNSISVTGSTAADGGYEFKIVGKRFDFGPLLDRVLESGDLRNVGWTRPYRVEINLDEVFFGSDEGLRELSTSANFDGEEWQSVIVEAGVGETSRLSLTYEPDPDGHRLEVASHTLPATRHPVRWGFPSVPEAPAGAF